MIDSEMIGTVYHLVREITSANLGSAINSQMIYFIENIVKYSRFSVSVNAICECDRCVENAGFYFAIKKHQEFSKCFNVR
jgi:hypothetical protein